MAGRIKQLIEELIILRSRGRTGLEHFVRAHLVLNGIDPDGFDEKSADDPEIVRALQQMISDFKKRT